MQSSSSVRGLFGGAITAIAPDSLVDASDLRQVPDTQEVFMYPDNGISIIVEILESVDASTLDDAARFHFNSLAHDNDAQTAVVNTVNTVPNTRGDDTPAVTRLTGTQGVPKFNRTHPDTVQIFLGLYRVDEKNTDVVVSFNVPMTSEDDGAVNEDGREMALKQFEVFTASLTIVDFGLFA